MCKVLGIRYSTYYKRVNWAPSQREIETQKLDAETKMIYFDSKKCYGAQKIHNILLSDGRTISLKHIQRRMVAMGLRSIVVKKYHHYSDKTKVVEQENILQQNFTATAINQKWCTDITYIYILKDYGHTWCMLWTFIARRLLADHDC